MFPTVRRSLYVLAALIAIAFTTSWQAAQAATANDDYYDTAMNTTLVVAALNGVLANDALFAQHPVRVVLVSNTTDGALALNEDGSFSYAPDPSFTGTDSFTYAVVEPRPPGNRGRRPFEQPDRSQGSANVATVFITVTSSDAVVHLPLDEGSGSVAGDVSGMNNDGTLVNGASFEASSGDGSPSAVRFDGIDDYIGLGNLDVNGTGLTLAAWFNADAFPGPSSDPRIISKAAGQTANDHIFMLSTVSSAGDIRLRTRLRIGGTTSTLIATSGDAQSGQWYHAAVTYDGTTVRLYLDGVEVGSQPRSGAIDVDPAVPVAVGDQPPPVGARPFDGLIDDVRILQRALSPAEIIAIVGDPPPNNAPVAAPDMYATGIDTPLNVNAVTGVLQNDTDADMDPLQAMLVNDVNDGGLALSLDGSFTYTPDPAFAGTDSFTYYATDGTDSSNIVAVTIVVSVTPNNPPIALPDQYSTGIDAPLIVNMTNGVLKNDSDPDLDPLDAVLVDEVADGALSLSLDGSFTYMPDPAFEGVDGFTYFATDGTDDSDTVAVTITVTDSDNTAPQIVTGVMVFTKDVIDNTVDNVHEVVAGDLDGDLDRDLVATDYLDGDVYWYENDGSGNFTRRVLDNNLVGAYPAHIDDVDLDGDNDVLAAGYDSDTFAWYENIGGGNFTRHNIDTAALGAHSIVTVDLDEDGDNDLLTTNQDSHDVDWYENDGNENFTRRSIDDLALNAKRAGFADLDNDNDIDVFAASNGSDQITWYENDGSENFTERLIDTADGAYYVFEADVTGNGSPDILSASQLDHTIALYKNDGSGSFTTQIIDTNALGARTVMAADLDRDGDIDPMSASVNDDRLSWYENDGVGGFTKRTLDDNAAGGYAIRPYDVEPDGDIDVLGGYRDANQVVIHYQSRSHEAALLVAGGTLLIDSSLLLTTDADDGPTELTYTLTQLPLYGDVELGGIAVAQGGTFTQADINNSLVTYEHDGSPSLGDLFAFTVADGGEGGWLPVSAKFFITIPDASALAHYPLDETSGTVAPDIANNNDGTLVGGPIWLPSDGKVAGGLNFDGADDRVDIGALDAVGTGISITAWLRADTFGNQGRLVSKATGTAEQDHYWMAGLISNTAMRFRLKAGGTTSTLVTPGNTLTLNDWYHIACTYDGAEMRIYVDGAPVVTLPKTGTVDVNPAVQAALGNQPAGAGSNGFDGTIDDVRIYQRGLSPAEVSLLANPIGGSPSSGAAHPRPAAVEADIRHQLLASSPNPFNPSTTIRYQMARATDVTITIYDVRGSRVRTLVRGRQPAGLRAVTWDGRDRRGNRVGSGVYFVQFRTATTSQSTKITLIE